MENFLKEKEKYFLTPVCLVPNGRAHLGHIAGPLLKMDVLKRFLVQCGADVSMISVSDSHESHVTIKAFQKNTTPEDIANKFHDIIDDDLKTLGIEYDDFINPLDPAWAQRYENINRELIDLIIKNDGALIRNERVPHLVEASISSHHNKSLHPHIGDPVVSGWLRARCPNSYCQQPLVGFFCESCGGHFEPSEMKDIQCAHFEGKLELKDRKSIFLNIPDGPAKIESYLKDIKLRSDFFDIAGKFLEKSDGQIRLTVPSKWGLQVTSDDLETNEVIWSYSALILGCHLLAGERYKELRNSEHNPFDKESNIKIVLSFGIDNAVPFLVGVAGCGIGQNKYKPIDHYLVNYFYDLDGSKFSTSREHVIWGGDIVKLGGADRDLVRAYLCKSSPEFSRSGFEIQEFIKYHNAFGAKLKASIETCITAAGPTKKLDASVIRYLNTQFATLADGLNPDTFDFSTAITVVEQWVDKASAFSRTPASALTWLVGYTLLAGPLLPDTASWVARAINAGSSMTIKNFLLSQKDFFIDTIVENIPLRASALSIKEFNGCLPVHLRS
jgi:methionyl-tRNA synthetase